MHLQKSRFNFCSERFSLTVRVPLPCFLLNLEGKEGDGVF